jgi:SAM-dependent methyltransferase
VTTATSILAAPAEETLARCTICEAESAVVVSRAGVLYNRADEPATVVSRLCLGCGVIYTSPRLSRETLARFYDLEQAPRRAGPPAAQAVAAEVTPKALGRLEPVLPFLGPRARVLEIGAGDGRTVAAFARCLPGGHVTGLDPAFPGDAAPLPNVRLLAGRLDDRTTPPGLEPPYDCITGFHVLEHQHDPVAFLRRLAGLLSPEGLVYMEVPNAYRPWWRGKPVETFFCAVHLFNFGPRALATLLRVAGFTPVAISTPAKALRVIARAGAPAAPPTRSLTRAEVRAIRRHFAGWRLYSRWHHAPGLGRAVPLLARAAWVALAPSLTRAVQ